VSADVAVLTCQLWRGHLGWLNSLPTKVRKPLGNGS